MTAPDPPEVPLSRRAARAMREEAERRARETDAPARAPRSACAELLSGDEVQGSPARHVRPRRLARAGVVALIATGGVLLLGSTAAVTALVSNVVVGEAGTDAVARLGVTPLGVSELPVPNIEQTPASTDICADPEVVATLEARDDEGAIATAGGGEAFRVAVTSGNAPCVDLGDPARIWVVVNKQRPYDPIDYRPSGLMMPDGVRSLEGGALRSDAASALTSLVTAAREAGVGELALESGFRSYETQQGSYGRQVGTRGAQQADLVSARPGHSEHQSGLTGDVVACAGGCGTIDELAATPQGAWVADHAWEHGWIVRYVEGATDVTGFLPEPWHLRYIGPELARTYHDGGWTSLEEFFGLGPAPDYAD